MVIRSPYYDIDRSNKEIKTPAASAVSTKKKRVLDRGLEPVQYSIYHIVNGFHREHHLPSILSMRSGV